MARAFADTAVTALWQSAALALGLALCLRVAPRISASDRFRVWAAGFAVVAALPFLPGVAAFFHSMIAADGGGATFAAPMAAPHAWLELNPRWSFAIAVVWMAVSLARAADLAVHSFRLRGLWKRAVAVEMEERYGAGLETRTTAGREAGGTSFEVCTTRELDRPSVIGFFRPRILIPEWLLERLTPAELEQVILHESEHLRRRDDWTNLVQKLCLVVFPLNPALLWMERRLCREREMACDEGVVRRTHSPRAYAACLTSLAQRGLERSLARRAAAALSLGAWQRRPELVERVHRILRRTPSLSPAAARALLAVVGCGLLFGAGEFARCPQLVAFAAQPAPRGIAETSAENVVDGQAMSGFHAVDAIARVPSRAEMARMRAAASSAQWTPGRAAEIGCKDSERMNGRGKAEPLRQAQGRHSAAAAVAVSARDDRATANVSRTEIASDEHLASAAGQQWVVFTAWEQIETVTPATPSSDAAANRAKTDSAGDRDEASAAAAPVIRQYTVTRLILRVYPAGKAKAGSAGAKSAPNSNLMIGLPAAVPLRDGWLVFQL